MCWLAKDLSKQGQDNNIIFQVGETFEDKHLMSVWPLDEFASKLDD